MARLVVIEDNPADMLLLRDALTEAGLKCSLERYTNGEEALQAVASMSEVPDLILLDLNLPRVHGFEILKAIRERPLLAGAKVAVLTTSPAPADKLQSQKLGADAYIVKPSGYVEFLARVSTAIKQLLGGAGAARHLGKRRRKNARGRSERSQLATRRTGAVALKG
jgi:DNA-binding response OmpR family regulator